jgi:hypothetical protein
MTYIFQGAKAFINIPYNYAASSGRGVEISCISIRARAAGVAPLSGELMVPWHDRIVRMSSRTLQLADPCSLWTDTQLMNRRGVI